MQGAGAYDLFGLTGEWNATDNLTVSGGVDNLFNREPEKIGIGQVTNIATASGGGADDRRMAWRRIRCRGTTMCWGGGTS